MSGHWRGNTAACLRDPLLGRCAKARDSARYDCGRGNKAACAFVRQYGPRRTEAANRLRAVAAAARAAHGTGPALASQNRRSVGRHARPAPRAQRAQHPPRKGPIVRDGKAATLRRCETEEKWCIRQCKTGDSYACWSLGRIGLRIGSLVFGLKWLNYGCNKRSDGDSCGELARTYGLGTKHLGSKATALAKGLRSERRRLQQLPKTKRARSAAAKACAIWNAERRVRGLAGESRRCLSLRRALAIKKRM